ncbi:hypothetical protein ABH995_000919 [Bradyrhizobium yuanmingense]|uniref:hypothetical protein n=1 Tax=Bradyrhizobium yuanmingense TaxID=108015 RepID=UPI003511FF2F
MPRAAALGITGVQMMLLIDGVGGRGRGQGAPVNVLAKLMKVDPSFVTARSKLLERKRLLRYQAM